jgi:hypothetical protein
MIYSDRVLLSIDYRNTRKLLLIIILLLPAIFILHLYKNGFELLTVTGYLPITLILALVYNRTKLSVRCEYDILLENLHLINTTSKQETIIPVINITAIITSSTVIKSIRSVDVHYINHTNKKASVTFYTRTKNRYLKTFIQDTSFKNPSLQKSYW